MGRVLITIGIFIVLIGVILIYAPNLFSWFGKLPGDINIQDERKRIFIPITSMIIASAVVSLLMYLYRKFF
ncbi:DUF2905 domain-containing protein [Spongiivirga sp. MCCC 1A20706]|uniref:DUF2905 domain-containing protein n=1 Tax=Spongiivirga sp. MCCC 1A20706 TaxID=3160963 RepID=UPI0039778A72